MKKVSDTTFFLENFDLQWTKNEFYFNIMSIFGKKKSLGMAMHIMDEE